LFCALAGVLCLAIASSSKLIINEILYDPPGSDGGKEFVELLCAESGPCSLDGIRLEFLNGSDPERPKVLWTADAGSSLGAGERYLLAESDVVGAQSYTSLGIQNGPDALRLMRGDAQIDAVAWGEIAGLGEGAPAPDASSQSLARIPDGVDSDDNAADFRSSEPTAGKPNSFAHALQIFSAEAQPAWLPSAGTSTLSIGLRFVGDLAAQRATLVVSLDGLPSGPQQLQGGAREELNVDQALTLFDGQHAVEIRTNSVSGHSDSLVLALQTGFAALSLSEVLPAPRSPEPEWIELRATRPTAELWSIADRSSTPRGFEPRAAFHAPGLLLLSEDCLALRAFRSIPDSVDCMELDGGWINLNNSASEQGEAADRIRLFDARGAIVDEFAYGATAPVVVGQSYERSARGGVWLLSPGEPTPGSSNASDAARLPTSGLALSPEIFTPDGDGVGDVLQIVLRPEEELRRIQATVVDLSGELVCELGAATADGIFQRWSWAGADAHGKQLPWGAYVVLIRAQAPDGSPRRWRSIFALGRRS
jgi:hypothetical protein